MHLPQDSGVRDYSLVPRVSCWAVDKTLSGLMTSLKHSSAVFTVIYVCISISKETNVQFVLVLIVNHEVIFPPPPNHSSDCLLEAVVRS